MRQIKFRVPHFNYNGSFSHFSYWGAIDNGTFVSPSSTNNTTKGWHQQFTGLHDKNGVEIYEGDVVRSETYNMDKKEVRWSYTYWSPFLYYMSSVEEYFEVIGNIYENPELLNAKLK